MRKVEAVRINGRGRRNDLGCLLVRYAGRKANRNGGSSRLRFEKFLVAIASNPTIVMF